MKTIALTILMLLVGCAKTYTKPEIDNGFKKTNEEFIRQLGYITTLNNRVFAKEIEKCRNEKAKAIDFNTGECKKQ